ncbi:MAG: hypothetical protein KatS3mg027_2507 [Bacteroidia bacterium]|nr:MAG: hypothetical protein KatS3mg027_2507 [Bacteroidia bacterium]
MIREKIKWLDPVTQGILIAILAMIVFLIMKKRFLGVVLLSTSALRLGWSIKKEPGLILENDYPGEFFIKPEEGPCDPVKIKPDTPLPIAVDGININGRIFKVRSGTNVKITKDGSIITYSPISRLLNEYIDIKKMSKTDRECWGQLL